MKKIIIGIVGGFLAVFVLLIAGIIQIVTTTPAEELTPEMQEFLGYLDPLPGTNVVNGISWMTPCNYTESTSRFGMRDHPIYDEYRMHYGVDMGAPQGTPIYATRSGIVSYSGYNDSAGNHVVIIHDQEFSSVYMHMVYYIVAGGEEVRQGQIIGYVGSTGDSTGPHLHFEIRQYGVQVDPELYIDMNRKPPSEADRPVTDADKEVM